MERLTFNWLWARAEARAENGVTQAQHALQVAHRAELDGSDDELVVVALVHDLGKPLNEVRHGQAISACLPQLTKWQVGLLWQHEAFVDAIRERDHDYPALTSREWRLARWDAASFDPAFETPNLEHYLPLLEFE